MSVTGPSRANDRTTRRGVSLLELLMALVIVGVLAGALGASVMIASRAVGGSADGPARTLVSSEIIEEIIADLRVAESFSTRTATAVTITVPDRDGDELSESIAYAWSGPPGYQLTRQFNTDDPVVLADDVRHFDLDYLTRFVVGVPPPVEGERPPTVLFVVPDPAALHAEDSERRTLIISWGFAVELIAAAAPQVDFDDAVATSLVAYVSERINPADLGTKLRDVTIGVVNEEGLLIEEFGFGDDLWVKDLQDMAIVDPSHYITTGFGTPLQFLTDKKDLNLIRVVGSAPGLRVLAEKSDDANMRCLTVLEPGDALIVGGTAAGRRVQLPWGNNLAMSTLNTDGESIMRRAIEWAAGLDEAPGGGPAPTAAFGYETEFTTPVSGVRRKHIATQATLTESGTVTSLSAYVDGTGHKVRLAIYTDSSGEPGTLIVESETVTHPDLSWVTIPVDPTALTAGTYWLALSFDHHGQAYFQEGGGETRYGPGWATKNGFNFNWAASTDDYPIRISIYASYAPE